jgi:hypothetical protein
LAKRQKPGWWPTIKHETIVGADGNRRKVTNGCIPVPGVGLAGIDFSLEIIADAHEARARSSRGGKNKSAQIARSDNERREIENIKFEDPQNPIDDGAAIQNYLEGTAGWSALPEALRRKQFEACRKRFYRSRSRTK